MVILNCDRLLRIERVQVLASEISSRSNSQKEFWDRKAVWLELLIELFCWCEPVNPLTISSTRKLLELTYSPQRSAKTVTKVLSVVYPIVFIHCQFLQYRLNVSRYSAALVIAYGTPSPIYQVKVASILYRQAS